MKRSLRIKQGRSIVNGGCGMMYFMRGIKDVSDSYYNAIEGYGIVSPTFFFITGKTRSNKILLKI